MDSPEIVSFADDYIRAVISRVAGSLECSRLKPPPHITAITLILTSRRNSL